MTIHNGDFIETEGHKKISINPDVHIKVSGFGFAELFDVDATHRQQLSTFDSMDLTWETMEQLVHPFCCTKSHMSTQYRAPKIWHGLPYDARKSDTWEMGMILFKMATGTYPYHFTDGSEPLDDSGNV